METLQQKRSRQAPQLVPVFSEDAESFAPKADRSLDDALLLDSYSQTIAAVVRRVAPSVVNMRVLSGERGTGGGSGFILARDGFILTNSHVVQGARDIEVTLRDARAYLAQLIGTDPETDLAVMRMGPRGSAGAARGFCRFGSDRSWSRSVALRISIIGDGGYRQRAWTLDACTLGTVDGRNHPDRRRAKPRQLRRAALEYAGEVMGVNTAVIMPGQGICFAMRATPQNLWPDG